MIVNTYFAVDLGATSGRTILAVYDGQKVEMRELTRFRNPIVPAGGHLFWDIAGLYEQILLGLKKAADEGVVPDSIGIDTWGCDFAFFGKDGQLLGLPYCYRDSHTEGAQALFFERMPAQEVYSRTGIQFMDFNSLFQLDTLRRNGCQALEYADKVLFIPDALIYMLTGEAVCEYTVASTSQMLNPMTGDLDEGILKVLGLPRDKFGRMVQPGDVVGTISSQVQEFTGLPAVKVVAVAGQADTIHRVIQQRRDALAVGYLGVQVLVVPQADILTPPGSAGAEGFDRLMGDACVNGQRFRREGRNRAEQHQRKQNGNQADHEEEPP